MVAQHRYHSLGLSLWMGVLKHQETWPRYSTDIPVARQASSDRLPSALGPQCPRAGVRQRPRHVAPAGCAALPLSLLRSLCCLKPTALLATVSCCSVSECPSVPLTPMRKHSISIVSFWYLFKKDAFCFIFQFQHFCFILLCGRLGPLPSEGLFCHSNKCTGLCVNMTWFDLM